MAATEIRAQVPTLARAMRLSRGGHHDRGPAGHRRRPAEPHRRTAAEEELSVEERVSGVAYEQIRDEIWEVETICGRPRTSGRVHVPGQFEETLATAANPASSWRSAAPNLRSSDET